MTASIAGAARRADPEDLICPACARMVRPEPPSSSRTESGALVLGWSHLDGSGLCWQLSGELASPVTRGPRVRAAGGGR